MNTDFIRRTSRTSPVSRIKRAARTALVVVGAAAGLAFAGSASAQVSISVGQPGFYGQLNVGGYPPPLLYSPRPVVIERQYVGPPIYRYNACGRQVFFVQDSWYNNTYAPRYREHYRDRPVVVRENFYREPYRGGHHDNGNHYGHRDDRGDRGDHGNHGNGNGRGHDGGQGRGEGRGHDRGDDRGHGR
jgi:hypothetical protein